MEQRYSLPALLSGALLLGASAIFVRWSTPASPVVVGFYRMAFALPWIFLFASREATPKRSSLVAGLPWAVLGGLCFSMDLTLWHTALHRTSAANATLLVGLAPLWVNLFCVIFLGYGMSFRGWTGLVGALAGAVVLMFGAGARLSLTSGELLGACASFCYAGYTLALARARRDLNGPVAMVIVSLTCLLVFAILAVLRGDSLSSGFTSQTWMSLAALGLVVQGCAWWLISQSLGHLPPGLGSLGLLLQQASTVLLGWLLLGERLALSQLFGMLLILAGIVLSARGILSPGHRVGKMEA